MEILMEISQNQYAQFLNTITAVASNNRYPLPIAGGCNPCRNALTNTGPAPDIYFSTRPYRAQGYLPYTNVFSYLDWAALRPMTELEFEKIARGPVLPVSGEYAWGTTSIVPASNISSGVENGAETIMDSLADAHYNNMTLTGGDTPNGADHQQGPLRIGIFAPSTSDRQKAGASYYGVMDLSGNVRERVVTIGNATGRNFTGIHGNGILSTISGYEGNANEANWPGLDSIATRGVTAANGSGFKGGGWDDTSARLRISDRSDAANALTDSLSNSGGRGVRIYDGN